MLDLLRCPRCGAERQLGLAAAERDEHEVRSGTLTCEACGAEYAVRDGIVDLLVDPPAYVTREAAGLERFAEHMREQGWTTEMVAGLPDSRTDLDYWKFAGDTMRALLERVELRPGDRIVDLGSNTCWAAAWFARLGLEVVALDISGDELQGLRAAESHLAQGVYYERLLSTMSAPALASEAVDFVFCSEVLHHNDPAGLRATLRELHRVLRPGGRALVVNEPMRFPLQLKRDHAHEVAEYDGHEYVYFLHEYLLAARRAGFRVRIAELVDDPFFDDRPLPLWLESSVAFGARQVAKNALRRSRLGRRAYLYYKSAITGDVPLSLTLTKEPR
jgi:SAM-dependent methyltransferase